MDFSFLRLARALGAGGLVLAMAALFACQSTPATTPQAVFPLAPAGSTVPASSAGLKVTPLQGTPGKELNLSGSFAFVGNDGHLRVQDAAAGTSRVLVPSGQQGYAQYPAFSPDGKLVAYAYTAFTDDGRVKSEIRVKNLDGTNERTVAAPQDLRIVFDLPAWGADGKDLYVTQLTPVEPNSQRADIYRVNVDGGTMTQVIADAFEASLSPDGKKIVFQRVDFSTYNASLWIAEVDGSGARQLVDSATFAAMFGMRFSPDSTSILFAASGPAKKRLPGLQVHLAGPLPTEVSPTAKDDSCLLSVLFTCWLQKAEAHGLPWDLYLANLDGTKFERLTEIGADSPVPIWSSDGKYIAFFEATGIYMIDREKKAIYAITHTGGYGGFDWR